MFAKYMKIEMLTFFGSEHYCPLSILRYGNSNLGCSFILDWPMAPVLWCLEKLWRTLTLLQSCGWGIYSLGQSVVLYARAHLPKWSQKYSLSQNQPVHYRPSHRCEKMFFIIYLKGYACKFEFEKHYFQITFCQIVYSYKGLFILSEHTYVFTPDLQRYLRSATVSKMKFSLVSLLSWFCLQSVWHKYGWRDWWREYTRTWT